MKGDEAAAARYAQAIFELARDAGRLEKVTSDLARLAETFGASKELESALENPVVLAVQKEAIVREVCAKLGSDELVLRSVLVMSERGRIGALPEVARSLEQMADAVLGIERAEVTTAADMDEAFYSGLEAGLSRSRGKRVILRRRTDKSLIGGAVLRVGGRTMDHSVQSHLKRLERELLSQALAPKA